jgi:prepilin-type N-terminal cleavage/methylation domain-containing protein
MIECGQQPAAGGRAARVGPFAPLVSRASRRGFTLLEMLLTLALIALLAGALIGGSSALLAEKPPSAHDVFWSTVRTARKTALNTEQDLNLRYDEKTKAFQLTPPDGGVQSFPIPVAGSGNDLIVEFLAAQKTGGSILLGGTVVETEPLSGGVTFYADGTCTPFRLQIRVSGGAHIIAIDPWTCSPVLTPPKSTP